MTYRKSSIKPSPPGGQGLIYFTHIWGGLNRDRGAYLRGRGGLFDLAKTMVSVLLKELEYKVENFSNKKLEVMQPRIKNKSELPVGE